MSSVLPLFSTPDFNNVDNVSCRGMLVIRIFGGVLGLDINTHRSLNKYNPCTTLKLLELLRNLDLHSELTSRRTSPRYHNSNFNPPPPPSTLPLLSQLETIDANDLEDCKKVDDAVWRRGDLDNMDSPLDAGWRQTCESMIQSTANGCGVEIGGVTWDFGKITIEVPSTASSDDQSLLAKQLNEVFENVESDDPDVVDCLVKHSLEIRTPGSQNLIVTQQQFDAYKGEKV